MTINEYQQLARRTIALMRPSDKIENGCFGLCGEAGEVIDLLKKYYYQGHELDRELTYQEAIEMMIRADEGRKNDESD